MGNTKHLMLAYKAGNGLKNGLKFAYVIFEWSPRECQLKQHIERSCLTFWDTLHPSKLKKQRSSLKGSNIRSLKTVPDSSIKYYRCNACGIKFARKVKLKQHKTKNHAEEKHLLVVLENLKSIPFNKNELKMKPSKRVCGFTFECFLYTFSS